MSKALEQRLSKVSAIVSNEASSLNRRLEMTKTASSPRKDGKKDSKKGSKKSKSNNSNVSQTTLDGHLSTNISGSDSKQDDISVLSIDSTITGISSPTFIKRFERKNLEVADPKAVVLFDIKKHPVPKGVVLVPEGVKISKCHKFYYGVDFAILSNEAMMAGFNTQSQFEISKMARDLVRIKKNCDQASDAFVTAEARAVNIEDDLSHLNQKYKSLLDSRKDEEERKFQDLKQSFDEELEKFKQTLQKDQKQSMDKMNKKYSDLLSINEDLEKEIKDLKSGNDNGLREESARELSYVDRLRSQVKQKVAESRRQIRGNDDLFCADRNRGSRARSGSRGSVDEQTSDQNMQQTLASTDAGRYEKKNERIRPTGARVLPIHRGSMASSRPQSRLASGFNENKRVSFDTRKRSNSSGSGRNRDIRDYRSSNGKGRESDVKRNDIDYSRDRRDYETERDGYHSYRRNRNEVRNNGDLYDDRRTDNGNFRVESGMRERREEREDHYEKGTTVLAAADIGAVPMDNSMFREEQYRPYSYHVEDRRQPRHDYGPVRGTERMFNY